MSASVFSNLSLIKPNFLLKLASSFMYIVDGDTLSGVEKRTFLGRGVGRKNVICLYVAAINLIFSRPEANVSQRKPHSINSGMYSNFMSVIVEYD